MLPDVLNIDIKTNADHPNNQFPDNHFPLILLLMLKQLITSVGKNLPFN
jgi:hypothetical protein